MLAICVKSALWSTPVQSGEGSSISQQGIWTCQRALQEPRLVDLVQGLPAQAREVFSSKLRRKKKLEARGFVNARELSAHFGHHGPEFGFAWAREYEDAALAYAQVETSFDLVFQNPFNKKWYKYDWRQNYLLVVDSRGAVVTFFRPQQRNNLAYFLNQYYRQE